jgi:protein TonB
MSPLLRASILAVGCHALLILVDIHGGVPVNASKPSREPLTISLETLAIAPTAKVEAPSPPPPKPVLKTVAKPKKFQRATPKTQNAVQPIPKKQLVESTPTPETKEIIDTVHEPPPPVAPPPIKVPAPLPYQASMIEPPPNADVERIETPSTVKEKGGARSDNELSRKLAALRPEPAPPIKAAVPLYKDNTPPRYPGTAKRRRLQGTVMLKVLVNRSGRVADIDIDTSSGHSVLDKAAMRAVRRWVFEPGKKGETPTDMWVNVPVSFKIK